MANFPEFQRLVVNLPAQLVSELDLVTGTTSERSQVIAEAMRWYLFRRKQQALHQKLKDGYQEMAELNRTLAEEGWRGLDAHDLRGGAGDLLLEGE